MRQHSVDHERQGTRRHDDFGSNEQLPSVHSVGIGTSPKRKHQQWNQLRSSQHSNDEAGMSQLKDLIWNSNIRDHAPEHRDELPDIKKPVITVFAERSEIQKHVAAR